MVEKLVIRLTNKVAEDEKEIDYHKVNELVEMGFDPEVGGLIFWKLCAIELTSFVKVRWTCVDWSR